MIWSDPPEPLYVAIIATQAAYHAQLDAVPAPPRPPSPPLKDCKECKGTGKIRTGDNQNWTACPCTDLPRP
jgi:hypothetical protein